VKKIKNYKNKKKNLILIADRGRSDVASRLGFMASLIIQKKKYSTLIISEQSQKKEINELFSILNIQDKLNIDSEKKTFFFNLLIFINFIISVLKISILGFDWFVKNFKINQVFLGDLIYDKYIRNDFSYLNPKILNKKFLALLYKSIQRYFIVDQQFTKNNVKFSIIGSLSYISISTLILRISQKKNIPTIYLSGDHFKIFKKNTKIGDTRKEFINEFDKHANNSIIKKAQKYFLARTKGQLKSKKYSPKLYFQHDEQNWFGDTKNKHFINRIMKLKNKFKNVVLIAPHAFSESNHLYGDLIFRDFYQQTIQTLNFAKTKKNTLWLFKPHPWSEKKYGEYNSTIKQFKNYKQDNIILVPKNVKTSSLFNFIDLTVSSRGTICLESATFGIKSIITSQVYYADLNTSYKAKNKNDYFKKLNNINLIKRPNEKSILRAKIALYKIKKMQRENIFNLTTARKLVSRRTFLKKFIYNHKKVINKKNIKNKLYMNILKKII
jgi:hypothetical protein